ncbi:MAG: molybdopterin converting factor subunit 1 [Betaproteobacteria bacterium]|nr:MAG: molybdopterin converting factor subunit 1 [Betaproteobacteria bacterium]
MKIRLLFFAGLREQLGTAGEELELPAGVHSVAALRAHLRQRGPAWQAALADGKLLRTAVNQNMASAETKLAPDDEVAFFPPVTGG